MADEVTKADASTLHRMKPALWIIPKPETSSLLKQAQELTRRGLCVQMEHAAYEDNRVSFELTEAGRAALAAA